MQLSGFGIVGNKGCGKRSFLERAIHGKFVESEPSPHAGFGDNTRTLYKVPVVLDSATKESIEVGLLHDSTSLSVALARLNPFKRSYAICFDITNRASWEYIASEAQALGPHYAGIVVGLKADLDSERQVSKEEAEDFCKSHNAKYFECSAKTGQNVEEALRELVRVALPAGYSSEKNVPQDHRCMCM